MTVRQRFKQSIKCGTGEAYFILQDNPTIDFSKDIIKAAIKNLAYDNESEGNRSEYIARLINLSNKKDKIVKAILKALVIEDQDVGALDQLFDLAAIFAEAGDKKARQAIYKRYGRKVIKGAEWLGEDALIKLGGIEGLKHIAKTRGKSLIRNPDDWEDSSFVDYFQGEYPKINAYGELEKVARNDRYIEKYLRTIKKNKLSSTQKRKRTEFNYAIVKENIENKKIVPVPPVGIKDLTKPDIRKLADDFLRETNPIKQEKYLRVFARTKFPYDYQPILKIAKKKAQQGSRHVEYACKALKYFQASEIREFAIKKLNKARDPSDYLYLLVSNYEKDDYKLLTKIATKLKGENIIHSLVWGYIDIYKANKTKKCKIPLEVIYSKLNCGIHRYEILEILYQNSALSKRILAEMEFDSYEATRALYEKINTIKR